MIKCKHHTTSEFYVDSEEGNTCLDVCELKSTDEEGFIFLEDAIINNEICEKCPLRES